MTSIASTSVYSRALAESFLSRFRSTEPGVHHPVAGQYLNAYAGELTWRADNAELPTVCGGDGCERSDGFTCAWF